MSAAGTQDTCPVRPEITISKDTTLRFSLGALITLYTGAALGGWWLYGTLDVDRKRVSDLEARVERRLDALASDVNFTSKTLSGYTARVDRIHDSVQVLNLLSHRLEKSEHSGEAQERRMAGHDAKFEDLQRRAAEHAIVLDYIMRWINPGGPPKKRGISPFGKGAPATPDKSATAGEQ